MSDMRSATDNLTELEAAYDVIDRLLRLYCGGEQVQDDVGRQKVDETDTRNLAAVVYGRLITAIEEDPMLYL